VRGPGKQKSVRDISTESFKEENMKKLVAIALIAAMATVANAGIGFTAPAGDFNPGDVVTIVLTSTGACNGFNFDAISDGGNGGVASDIIMGAGLTELLPGYLENTSAGILIDYAAAYATGSPLGSGVALFTFSYTVSPAITAPKMITIAPLPAGTSFYSRLDDTTYTAAASTGDLGGVTTPIDGVTLSIIPEPMTLGLLGLGGLFLRRRLA
jgi:hypothetical protein